MNAAIGKRLKLYIQNVDAKVSIKSFNPCNAHYYHFFNWNLIGQLSQQMPSKNYLFTLGSGCGSVGRAIASNIKGLRFESSHRQKFIDLWNICLLSTVY